MKYDKDDLLVLAQTLYGEARGEFPNHGLAALIAVANVVVNRLKKGFAKNVRGVCLAPHQFSCWNHGDPNFDHIQKLNPKSVIFQICLNVAENVLSEKWPDLTDGCDHYHAKTVHPYWSAYRNPKRIFGNHLFYNLSNKGAENE